MSETVHVIIEHLGDGETRKTEMWCPVATLSEEYAEFLRVVDVLYKASQRVLFPR